MPTALVVSKPTVAPAFNPLFATVEICVSSVLTLPGVKSVVPPTFTASVAPLATLIFAAVQFAGAPL